MNYPFYSKKTMSFFVTTALLIIGCNDDKDKAVTATSTMSDTAVAMAPAPPAAGLTSGSLDTLWITAADFKALDKNKADFIFYFGTNDTVTLHGWKDKGGLDPYNPTPDVILKKGHKDATLTYGPGKYFGNLVLNDVNKIQKLITDNGYSYVIFAPQYYNNHVSYKIFLSMEAHLLEPKTMAIVPTGDDANPSPPKP